MSGSVPDSSAGLGMRLNLHVGGSIVELQLGQKACFFPTDAALQMIASHPSVHDMSIVYD
jgi:hypothetical protein